MRFLNDVVRIELVGILRDGSLGQKYNRSGQLQRKKFMGKDLTIHASSVKELFYYAVEHGATAEQLTGLSGIKAEHLNPADARIPLPQLVALWHAAIEVTGKPTLALDLGANSHPDNAGIISLVCMNSPTLGEMMRRVIRYMHLIAESDRFEILDKGKHIIFTFQIEAPECFTIYGIERTFAIALNWSRIFTGQTIKPIEMHFQYRAPDYAEYYNTIFSAPVLFEQSHNAMILDKALLDLPGNSYNEYLDTILQQQADLLLSELISDNSIVKQVQKLIIERLPEGELNVDMVADNLHMSRRTLSRKLKEEGITFQQMAVQTKKELAINYLKQNNLSINDIAFLLGFSESSSFSRAFRRWFGNYPLEYRKALV